MTKAKAGFELAISDLNAKMLTTTLCTRATINIDAFRLEYDFIVESALVHLCRMQIKVKFFFGKFISQKPRKISGSGLIFT